MISKIIPLNNSWEFTSHCTYAFLDGTEACGSVVRLPHTTRVTPFDYFDETDYQMDCAYRRYLKLDLREDQRVFLRLGAAGHHAEVWLDGKIISEHDCGYTAFETELTGEEWFRSDDLANDVHLLAIRVDSREDRNIPPFGHVIDYMTFGGLYREAELVITESSRISDVWARPEIDCAVNTGSGASFSGTVRTVTAIDAQDMRSKASERLSEPLLVRYRIFSRTDGKNALISEKFIQAAESPVVTDLSCDGIRAWDTEDPFLYTLVTELLHGGEVIDRRDTVIGFRNTEWKADGFYLNGRKVKLRGLNRHQSYPFMGYAMPAAVQKSDADILKRELGLNAVRTSHYPQSQHFIDRCDELGLLVFTEIPGWQHIGDEAWKNQAVENTREMVLQYRNHPSVILWGVRINESADDDAFYSRTNEIAHELDPSRATGGVRYLKKSSLLEDVYTYNDFSFGGTGSGCEKKKSITSDMSKTYLISEYNGHMYPTAAFFNEEHQQEHVLRHAAVLDAVAAEDDIAGSFGWCFADYNTHRDFGSGDRICYHGVTDMFRNPKPAAAVYAAQVPPKKMPVTEGVSSSGQIDPDSVVLEVTSEMNIGERPAGNPGKVWIITNADSVRMYKNDVLLKEYDRSMSPYRHLYAGPILIDDYIGDRLTVGEGYTQDQSDAAKYILNHSAIYGSDRLPPKVLAKAGKLMLLYKMNFEDAYRLYGKYIGSWGEQSNEYRFDAVVDGQVVKSLVKAPVTLITLHAYADRTELSEGPAWDAAAIRITMRDQNGNVLPYYQGAVRLETRGPIEVIGPETAVLRGGRGGTYVRTTGEPGDAALILRSDQAEPVTLQFHITTHNSIRGDYD